MSSEDVGAASAQPEAELVASEGAAGRPVKLFISNVYNGSCSKEVNLDATDTIADLKRRLQELSPDSPEPQQQRLIYGGKQCTEGQQIGHVLRGMDLSVRHTIHLVTQPSEKKPPAAVERAPVTPEPSGATEEKSVEGRDIGPRASSSTPEPDASTSVEDHLPKASRDSARMPLTFIQRGHLKWQYLEALYEHQRAIYDQHARYNTLARQFIALGLHNGTSGASYRDAAPVNPVWEFPVSWIPSEDDSEVATSAATRALDGHMPGPAAGAAVRDVTNGAPGMAQMAGLEEEDQRGRRNLVDPPGPAAPPGVNWGRPLLKLCGFIAVFAVFGKNLKEGWQLMLLGAGAAVFFLVRTGLLASILGADQEGGGLWRVLSSSASIIKEGGGLVMDIFYFCTSFVFSLFPPWNPRRSPEAIEREARARAAEAEAETAAAEVAAAAARRTEADQAGASPAEEVPGDGEPASAAAVEPEPEPEVLPRAVAL